MPWLVLDVKLTKFDYLLDQSSYGFQLVHGFLERVVCYNIDYMGLEVCISFLEAVIRAKATFSINGYRPSTPLNALLV